MDLIQEELYWKPRFLHKSIASCYRPVRVAAGPITARCRFMKNAYWEACLVHLDDIIQLTKSTSISSLVRGLGLNKVISIRLKQFLRFVFFLFFFF